MKSKNFRVVLILCLLTACRQTARVEPAVETINVKTADVILKKLSIPARTSGLVVSSRDVKLSFKTGGIIEAVFVSEGSVAKRGELLATLNTSEIEAQVKQAKNGYDKTVRDFNRVKNLFTDSVVTLEQMQNAETAMSFARSTLDAADFNLKYSRIIAPENGIIMKQLAEKNEIVAPGYPVLLFGISGKHWKVRAGLSDRDFVRIRSGDSSSVTLDAYPGVTFHAVVSQIGETANLATGTYEIELDLQSTDHKLASGFVAGVEIFPEAEDASYLLPVGALLEADGKTGYVFTVTDSLKAKKIKVTFGDLYDSSVVIISGLEGVKQVVTEGSAYLSEGDIVKITNSNKQIGKQQ